MGSFSVKSANLHVGAFNGATEVPLWRVPAFGGGVTILEAWMYSPGAGTAIGGQLVVMTSVATGGTPAISGTVGTFAGTIVTAAGVVHKLTVSTPFVDDTQFVGFDQTSGTVPAGTYIQLSYVEGK